MYSICMLFTDFFFLGGGGGDTGEMYVCPTSRILPETVGVYK